MILHGTYQQDVGNGYYSMDSPTITGKELLAGQRSISEWCSGLGILFPSQLDGCYQSKRVNVVRMVINENGMSGVMLTSTLND